MILGVLARPELGTYQRLEEAGVTGMICAPWINAKPSAESANRIAAFEEKRAAIERFAETIVAQLA